MMIDLKSVVPTTVAIVLGLLLSNSAFKYLASIDQVIANQSVAGSSEVAELPTRQLSRVRLLVSSLK